MSYKVKSPIPVIEGGTGDATFTDHAVLIGDVVAGIKTVGPGSVSGVPLIAQGVSADPIFGIANVVGGGTGGSTFTAYSLIAAGTTSTSSFQNISGVGTAGQILTSNGAGALPTWQSGGGATVSITGDSGGAIVSGSFTFTGGTTGLTFAGAGTTETLGGRLVVSNGGTGATTLTGVLIGNGTGPITANTITQYNTLIGGASNSITSIAPSVTSGIPFVSQGSAANPTFGTAVVAGGGTGNTVLSNHGVLLGQGTSPIATTAAGTTGQVFTGVTGADPVWASPAASSISITGNSGGALTGNAFTFTGGTTGLTFSGAGTTETLTGTLAIANGGTNATSMATTDGTVYFDGTRLVTTATGTSGQVLTSGGAGVAPAYASPAASSISITGNSGGALTGNAFTFTGGTTGLTFSGAGSTETLGGDLAVANGGTGNTTFTAYSVVCAGTTATGAFQNVSGLGTTGQVLTSNGASALPTWQTGGGGGGGITTIDGDDGSVTGSTITLTGDGGFNYAGASVRFRQLSPSTDTLGLFTTDINSNTFIGSTSGVDITSPSQPGTDFNTAVGVATLGSLTDGCQNNCAFGYGALASLSTLSDNIAIGYEAAISLTSGQGNVLLGSTVGSSYTGSESYNILIGFQVAGTTSESNVTRIGSGGVQTACFIDGISGISVTGSAVLVDSSGQLGVAISSRRYKENIQDMGDLSSNIFKLRPVSFNYTVGKDHSLQTGLIAEEVEEVMPSLVIYNEEGIPQTVKYHDLSALLLNEIQKLRKEVDDLKAQIKG